VVKIGGTREGQPSITRKKQPRWRRTQISWATSAQQRSSGEELSGDAGGRKSVTKERSGYTAMVDHLLFSFWWWYTNRRRKRKKREHGRQKSRGIKRRNESRKENIEPAPSKEAA